MSAPRRRQRIVLETILPDGVHPDLPVGLDGSGFEHFYASFSREASLKLRLPFRVALFLAIWVAPLLIRRLPPITLHDRPTRERALGRFFTARFFLFRQLALTIKLVLSLCYGADDRVRRTVGYFDSGLAAPSQRSSA